MKSFHLEAGKRVTDELIRDVASALRECAAWHKTPEVVVRRSDPKPLAARLQKALT